MAKKAATSADVLRRAKELISNRRNWLQHTLMTDAKGNEVSEGPDARKFCAIGALCQAEYELNYRGGARNGPYHRLEMAMDADIVGFNNARGRKHKDILKRFDEAIAAATR